MVGLRSLDPPIGVRIPASQPQYFQQVTATAKGRFSCFWEPFGILFKIEYHRI
jgi:hypothetical protein